MSDLNYELVMTLQDSLDMVQVNKWFKPTKISIMYRGMQKYYFLYFSDRSLFSLPRWSHHKIYSYRKELC